MRSLLLLIAGCFLSIGAFAQTGQLSIDRISQMPNLPSPYLMRDWRSVATDYDELVFSTEATGEYLPLVSFETSGVNYPELSPILLQTYVGTNTSNQAEAINIMPAIVSASLVDIDKSTQGGINWVEKTKDFFNKANGQNVYLNGYSTSSGGDWWYDIMPNIFFYQLYALYPTTSDYDEQFTSVADQWLAAVHAMGGATTPWTVPDMNYRAWNLSTMTGLTDGVKEPEAAGGIGWLLYHAYLKTGEKKYLEGAQMSIEFLSDWESNPSYELQLPYGAFVAAKMNAELGTTYDVLKIINWCFDRGSLRGWGSIVGNWNGSDVDGLIGEANDGGNDYAFIMNGFQQAGALVPLVKYDKRFARAIAKWTLNLANASRLFYAQYLPEASQDDYTWSTTNDPNSSIAYEALKEVWEEKPLYGTGDAKRNDWAETNLGLYGSSHVGYLGGIIETTDVEGILLLNANKTDFFDDTPFPTYLIYNPYSTDKMVTIPLPTGTYDVYDAISETTLATSASGSTSITIKMDEALLLTYVPAGSTIEEDKGKLYANSNVIDYHYGYDFTGSLRIKSLAAVDTLVEFNQQVSIYSTIENAKEGTTFTWLLDNEIIDTSSDSEYTFTVPEVTGERILKLEVESEGTTVMDSIIFTVVENVPKAPVINSITTNELWYATNAEATLTCDATDEDQSASSLDYHWIANEGSILNTDGNLLTWQAPATEGIYEITCEVTDSDAQVTTQTKRILVKPASPSNAEPFAYYPLDADVKDYSGNDRNAKSSGVTPVADSRGEADKAFRFNSGSDIIYVDNSSALNFQDKITLSFWVKLSSLSDESFILSHGSWEQRWKVSVTPDSYLRWTVKTNAETKDLDSSFPLTINEFYHFTVVYSGYSMEIYANGLLDNFTNQNGAMGTTANSLTFGRKDSGESNYYLNGTLDEVRIYNASLSPGEIELLKSIWNTTTNAITSVDDPFVSISIFPNPTQGEFLVDGLKGSQINSIEIYDMKGRGGKFDLDVLTDQVKILLRSSGSDLLILKIETQQGVFLKKIIHQ